MIVLYPDSFQMPLLEYTVLYAFISIVSPYPFEKVACVFTDWKDLVLL